MGTVCVGPCLLCPLQTCYYTLLWGSKAAPLSWLISRWWRNFPVGGTLFSFTVPSQIPPRGPGPSPDSFSLFLFSFVLSSYMEIFFALLEVWGLLPVDIQWGYSVKILSRYSVRIVSHVFLMYLWEKVNSTSCSSAILTRSPTIPIFDEDVEQLAFSYSAGRNVQWWNHFEKEFSSVLTS